MIALRITEHAVTRYQQRVDGAASDTDVVAMLLAGELQQKPPAGVQLHRHESGPDATVGWVWSGRAVFPVVEREDCLLAVTCIARRPKRSKAERRAWREWQREEMAAA